MFGSTSSLMKAGAMLAHQTGVDAAQKKTMPTAKM
jgi:hypothetical protein